MYVGREGNREKDGEQVGFFAVQCASDFGRYKFFEAARALT